VSSRGGNTRRERRSILFVGADAALRTVANLHLQPAGLDVLESPDEDSALELAGRGGIDAVVARAQGHRLGGATILERLRASEDARVRDLPVLLVSGARSAELAALCARLPPARAVAAPITGPRLVAALEALLRR
jgi:CheY-like chemotaxis protein